jgi:hypothetical protein
MPDGVPLFALQVNEKQQLLSSLNSKGVDPCQLKPYRAAFDEDMSGINSTDCHAPSALHLYFFAFLGLAKPHPRLS